MSDDRREKASQMVREAGYAMGGVTRPAKGGAMRLRGAQRKSPQIPPTAARMDPTMAAPPTADEQMPSGGPGFKSGGSVQGRARSAKKKEFGDSIKPPKPGSDSDGDSRTKVKLR